MELFELEEKAMVRSASGEALGEIERYVIDPSSRKVSHVVVKEGVIFTNHRLVPVDLIDHVDEEGPVLSTDVDPEQLEPFVTEHYVPMDQASRDWIDPRLGEASIWRYPTVATGYYPAYPGEPIPYRSVPDTTRVREVNVADDQMVLDEDTPVESIEGDVIGRVVEVTVDEDGGLSHLIVDFDDLEGVRVVPGHWIDTIRDDRIVLAVADPVLEHLEAATG